MCCDGETREAKYALRRVRVTISITYSVVLIIQRIKRMRRIVMCGLSGNTIFFHVIS